jgi:hypothetical protein
VSHTFKYQHATIRRMDLDAPMDAWYVWVGVALVSVGLLAFAVGLPSQPPPDAGRAAAAIDRVAASEHDAAARLDHDGAAVRVGPERIAMRNDGGTTRATLSFGPVLPLSALDLSEHQRTVLDGVLAGERPLPAHLHDLISAAMADVETESGEWRPAVDALRARSVRVDGERVVLVAA